MDTSERPVSLSGPFAGHPGPVMAVAVTPDGRTLVSGGREDGTVRTWDAVTGAAGLTLTGHPGGVLAVALAKLDPSYSPILCPIFAPDQRSGPLTFFVVPDGYLEQ